MQVQSVDPAILILQVNMIAANVRRFAGKIDFYEKCFDAKNGALL